MLSYYCKYKEYIEKKNYFLVFFLSFFWLFFRFIIHFIVKNESQFNFLFASGTLSNMNE